MSRTATGLLTALALIATAVSGISAQRGRGAGAAQPPQSAQAGAPIDLTGYWVPIVNEEYTPSPEEAAYARRMIEENRKAEAAGRASFSIDGKMIDVPVVVRAQRLLERLAAIEAREAKSAAPG